MYYPFPGSRRIEAMMCNEGQIFAFDRDGRRLKTMMILMQQRHVTCVEPAEKDRSRRKPRAGDTGDVWWAEILDMLVLEGVLDVLVGHCMVNRG